MTTIDPHNLIASGAELADEKELARRLNVSRSVLGPLLQGALYEAVRHVRERARRLSRKNGRARNGQQHENGALQLLATSAHTPSALQSAVKPR